MFDFDSVKHDAHAVPFTDAAAVRPSDGPSTDRSKGYIHIAVRTVCTDWVLRRGLKGYITIIALVSHVLSNEIKNAGAGYE